MTPTTPDYAVWLALMLVRAEWINRYRGASLKGGQPLPRFLTGSPSAARPAWHT
jgi:hypothetical protein